MGMKHDERQKVWLAQLYKQMERLGQGPADGPYWIVLNMSVHKNLNFQPPRFPFRHPTLEAATAEAERLSAQPNMVGWRFGVFEFTCVSRKTEKSVEQETAAE